VVVYALDTLHVYFCICILILFFFYFTEFMPSFMSVSYHRLLSFVYLFVDVE
jgi:hypothetical protein